MNYIDSIEIYGFWGTKNVSINFHKDTNFLIGPNGSGKTTVINLISSALRADVPTLYSIQFDRIFIKLSSIDSNKKPSIEVEKIVDKKMGNFKLEYKIREKATGAVTKYVVEGPYDERIYRDYKYNRPRRFVEMGSRLGSIVSDFVEVNWLSIHRTELDIERRVRRDEGIESTVDQKLHEISRAFSQYFSLLSSRAEIESKNFQEYLFLSLLQSSATIDRSDSPINEERDVVFGVLRDLGVSPTKARRSVDRHYKRLDAARQKFSADEKSIFLDDAIALTDHSRIKNMIEEWQDLDRKRNEIFAPKNKFESIINDLFSGKKIEFDARNTPLVHLSSGEILSVDVLSSGEKQIFIIIGEALLQEEKPVVFISDEPELSLHVKWQSTLFKNVRSLNGSCQIISATHSPDIVGPFQDRVIKIEECMSNV